jgi:integrase
MPRTPKFQFRKTASGWMVNVPATLSESGKRERHFHKTRDEAKEHASSLREKYASHGAGAAAIRPALAEDAARAMEILEQWGLSLTQAAQRVDAEMKKKEASVSFEEAGKAWVESLDGLRDRSIKSYEVTLNRLTAALSGRVLSTIPAEEIAAAIQQNGVASATQSLHRRNARAFWFWCAKKGWCEKDVFDGVPSPRKSSDKEIEFLTPDEACELLLVAEQAYPKAVPMYALALFAGIRAEELRRLDERHVTLEGIDMPAVVTKKGRRRHITPNKTLQAWLQVYPFRPCPNWKQVDCAIRRLAGWDVAASMLECPPEPSRGRWPQNALRHSHATYAIAAGEPLEKLLFEFGHVGGIEVLRKHYVGRATKKQAEEFFSLRPSMTAN